MPEAARGPSAGGSGPLAGVRVVELAAIGPAPYAVMLLADLGAGVVRVDRAGEAGVPPLVAAGHRVLDRGRRSIAVDLKQPEAVEVVLRLVERADVLVEGFRPGVAERLGVGPDRCLARNPRLVYGRMTGWGQHGPYARQVGHDLNYIGVTGLLHSIGPAGGPPLPPVNVAGDFGGGGALLAFGVVAALLRARETGTGDVVDAAIVDGAASLMAMTYALHAAGLWRDERGANVLDGGAPFYATYACADGRFVAVAALEDRFFAALLAGLGLAPEDEVCRRREDPAVWPALRDRLAGRFVRRSREEWCAVFAGTEACVTPVLSLAEAPGDPHLRARGSLDASGAPGPVPRFAAHAPAVGAPAVPPGSHTRQVLAELGSLDVAGLLARGVVAEPPPAGPAPPRAAPLPR